ncbi:monomeric sarcosine oxidase [Abditibacteriota bacterium]|nr:monomeric sarcosine oxidase [Abditibacteriota bacterium]
MGQVDNFADVLVLGLGAMGSAATYQLARQGASVIAIDQFSPPHKMGSTHGDTRITRQAIGEGEVYTPLALRSYKLWDEIEKETGTDLLTMTGGLIIADASGVSTAHGNADFMGNTLRSAEKYGIGHERLDVRGIQTRYPQFKLRGHEMGYLEYKAGFLRPERCVEAQLDLAKRHGAKIYTGEKVLEFVQERDGVSVKTDRCDYKCKKLIISAGPWVSDFIGERYKGLFKVYRQVLYWFDVEDSYESFVAEKFPVFIWDFGTEGGGGIYGFPAIDGRQGGLKVAHEDYLETTAPDQTRRDVSPAETDEMFERFVEPRLVGVKRECVKVVICLYTVTPDSGFVIDTHPDYKDVIIASPCSGHGFKHSAAIGEALAQLATRGNTDIDISAFAFGVRDRREI